MEGGLVRTGSKGKGADGKPNEQNLDFGIWRNHLRQMATALDLSTLAKADPHQRRAAVYEGLPVKMLRALMKRGDISVGDLSRVIANRRTLERRLKDGERLNREESDRLARFLPILDLTEHIFGSTDAAMRWLRKPMRAFDGVAPLDLLSTSAGAQEVELRLQQSRHGMVA